MYRLTPQRKKQALDIFERCTRELHDSRKIDTWRMESALRECWQLGYQELKDVMIDALEHHSELTHIAAYYMEHQNAPGVVVEFQESLAHLYGLRDWYYDDSKDAKREAYWERAFASISQFDLHRLHDGSDIRHITDLVNDKLIAYFVKHPTHLKAIQPRAFEELVAELFDGFGFQVELTSRTRDGGRDVIAIGNGTIATSKYLIECKRYAATNKVGVVPVRSLFGVVTDERATKGILVTTSSFTPSANEFLERNKWVLEGRDFDGLMAWLKEYQRLKVTRQ